MGGPSLDPTAQAANAAVARAAPALSDAIGKLEKSLGVAPAGKHGSSGRGHRRGGGGGGANGHSRNRAAVSPLSSSSASSDSSSAASASSAQTAATASSLSSSSLRMVSTDELLAQLADLCDAKRADAPAHTLAPTALAAARGLLLFEVALEWDSGAPAALTTRRNALDAAATALRILRKTLDELIGPPPPAAASATSLAERAETAEEKAYCSLLLYIRENRDRLHQQAQSEQQAEAAAGGRVRGRKVPPPPPPPPPPRPPRPPRLPPPWRSPERSSSSPPPRLRRFRRMIARGQRALAMYRSALPGLPPTLSGVARRGHFAGGCSDAHGGGSSGVRGHGGGGVSRRRKPCSVCQGLDKRDALVCATCNTRMHLMCAWPPLESVSDEVWHCDACRSTVPPLRKVPTPGEELEAEVQESEANGGAVVWKRAVVLSARPKERFVLMINPDEEDDFIEEYGMEDEGKEWRRTKAAVEALNSARQRPRRSRRRWRGARERGRRPRPRDDA